MRLRLTKEFWDEIRRATNSILDYDSYFVEAKLSDSCGSYFVEEKPGGSCGRLKLSDSCGKYFKFTSKTSLDRHDFPLFIEYVIDPSKCFNTETFSIEDWEQGLIERDTEKDLLLKLANGVKRCYGGKIEKGTADLNPDLISVLNEIVQYADDLEYNRLDVFDRIEKLYENYRFDSKSCSTSYEQECLKRLTFRKILEELIEFDFAHTVLEQEHSVPISDNPIPSLESRVVCQLVEKLRYHGRSEDQ